MSYFPRPTKATVGLGNVDNTSDLAKPLSTASISALAGKVPTSRQINLQSLTADITLAKSDIGLGNVDNVSDANKPISTATQTALNAKVGGIALFDHFTNAGNITTGETDLYSDTVAAGQLAANGDKIQAEYGGVYVSSGTATREIKIYFAGTAIFDTGALTLSLSAAWTAYLTIIRVSSSTVRYMISFTTEGAALAAYTGVGNLGGLTLANTQVLKITGQAAGVGAASDDIVAQLGTVNYRKAA